jgi:hypothetical protein
MAVDESSSRLPTSYPYPWVLVFHNGHVEGQRPRTVLAFIHKALAEDGKIVGYRVTKFPGSNPTKHQCKIPPESVAHEFKFRRFEKPDRQRVESVRALVAKRLRRVTQGVRHA